MDFRNLKATQSEAVREVCAETWGFALLGCIKRISLYIPRSSSPTLCSAWPVPGLPL